MRSENTTVELEVHNIEPNSENIELNWLHWAPQLKRNTYQTPQQKLNIKLHSPQLGLLSIELHSLNYLALNCTVRTVKRWTPELVWELHS